MPMRSTIPKQDLLNKLNAISRLEDLYKQAGLNDFPEEPFAVTISSRDEYHLLASVANDEPSHTTYIYMPPENEKIAEFLLRDMERDDLFVVFTQSNYEALAQRARSDDERRRIQFRHIT